ncbi:GntR family transcriptional regulator [Williamsia phyllosphaerae]|uniref:GntR family transcriptional regulator n=1 Tax=Williamsia phyllosphaerae TaxID=885042 RepID=A0ABQ1V1A8_9NOCA|nr:GntR family transcriptional regulator [Williamsia phyllosphaerae]GGF33555.1 GntR family transcriptional regulator [Williamsia phyllosphaerae]
MDITIDPDSAEPPYEQVRRQVIELVGRGELLVGSKLPTVRALAAELSIAPNTAARAYRELEAADVIETRGRNGSFVTERSGSADAKAQRMTVAHVAELRSMGIGDEMIADMLSVALKRS